MANTEYPDMVKFVAEQIRMKKITQERGKQLFPAYAALIDQYIEEHPAPTSWIPIEE